MTDHAYTIQARELVPGLRLLVDGVPRGKVLRVWGHKDRISARVGNVQWLWVSDTLVTVRLPGPSPREVLCDCWYDWDGVADARWQIAAVPRDVHGIGCPVRKLRLRLWPIDAVWDTLGWVLEHQRERVRPENAVMLLSQPTYQWRGAFCEPESTT